MKSKNIAPWQIRLIHVAKSKLGLDEPQYREMLSGFNNNYGEPCKSCKDMNFDQAAILLSIFNKIGFKSKNKNQFEDKFNKERPEDKATIRQLGLIMGFWVLHSREKTLESLNKFCKRIIGIDNVEWLKRNDVNRLLKAIENL